MTGQPRRALDLGCGAGRYGPLLGSLAERVDGCDFAAPALDAARATAAYDTLFLADLSEAVNPLPAGAYDLVFCTEVIEHLADERRFARHLVEALGPGGLLVLTTTTYQLYVFYYWLYHHPRSRADYRDYLAGLVRDAPGDRFVRKLWMLTGGHEHGFRRGRLLRVLRQAGLEVVTSSYANVQPVLPVDGLSEPWFLERRGAWLAPLWRLAGRALNAGCRRTELYGANVMVAARKR